MAVMVRPWCGHCGGGILLPTTHRVIGTILAWFAVVRLLDANVTRQALGICGLMSLMKKVGVSSMGPHLVGLAWRMNLVIISAGTMPRATVILTATSLIRTALIQIMKMEDIPIMAAPTEQASVRLDLMEIMCMIPQRITTSCPIVLRNGYLLIPIINSFDEFPIPFEASARVQAIERFQASAEPEQEYLIVVLEHLARWTQYSLIKSRKVMLPIGTSTMRSGTGPYSLKLKDQ